MIVSMPCKRNDLIAILRLAEESDGLLSAERINTKLLFRPADSAHGMKVIELLIKDRLLEPSYRNTGNEKGYQRNFEPSSAAKDALRKNEVRLTERGNYRLHVTDDPLFKDPLLAIVPVDHSRDEDAERQANVLDLPAPLAPYHNGAKVRLALQGNREVLIESIAPGVRNEHSTVNAFVEVRTDEYGSIVLARSELCEGWAKVPSPIDGMDVLEDVFRRMDARVEWDDEDRPTLLLRYKDTELPERSSFIMSRSRIKELIIDGYGHFDHAEVEGIAIAPLTEDDAVEWANWLVRERLRGLASVTEAEFEELRKQEAGRFTRYNHRMLLLMMDEYGDLPEDATSRSL